MNYSVWGWERKLERHVGLTVWGVDELTSV